MAIRVTDTIKQILAARDAAVTTATTDVLGLLRELRRQVLAELVDAPGDSFTAYRLRQTLAGVEKHLADFEGGFGSVLGSGIDATWQGGASLLPEATAAAGVRLGFYNIPATVLDSLKEFAFGRVRSVSGDLFNKLRGELSLGVLGQKSPAQVAATIAGQLEGLPIPANPWGHPYFKSAAERAEVITGTEMGRAFSLATQKSMEAAGDTLPGLTKIWIHAGHPKQARPTHVRMHGEKRKIGKAFYTTSSGYGMLYPRDPNAPIKEVIRCGCTHIPYMAEFGDLEEFVADFDTKQDALWKGKRAA